MSIRAERPSAEDRAAAIMAEIKNCAMVSPGMVPSLVRFIVDQLTEYAAKEPAINLPATSEAASKLWTTIKARLQLGNLRDETAMLEIIGDDLMLFATQAMAIQNQVLTAYRLARMEQVRELCAKVAESYAAHCRRGSPATSIAEDAWGDVAGRDIARLIREQVPV